MDEADLARVESTPNNKAKLYTKLNRFRADVIQQDWSDDKMMSGKMSYKYLSTDKIKKQVAPLLVKHGLELGLQFEGLQFLTPAGSLEKQCTVTLVAKFIDIDTGESTTSKVYGEGGDFLDKAVSKAQTFALKEWLTSYLLLADGMDVDAMDVNNRFQPRSSSESEAVRSKVLENAVKPPAPKPVEAPKPAPKPEVKEEAPAASDQKEEAPVPKEEAVAKPKAPAPKPKAPAPKPKVSGKADTPVGDNVSESPDSPTDEESKPVTSKYNLSGIQKKIVDKIIEDWTQLAMDKKVTSMEYNSMSYDRATFTCPEDVRNFIAKYKDGPK